MRGIDVVQLSGRDLAGMEKPWGELLADAPADPLFMGWRWQRAWWEVFSPGRPYELVLLAAREPSGRLVGLAPLYRTVVRAYGMRIRRLQFLGNAWRDPQNLRSEYIDFIVRHGREAEVVPAFLDHIGRLRGWDELVVCNHWTGSPTTPGLADTLRDRGYFVRELEAGTTFCVDTEGSFQDYLAGLGHKRRAKLFNHRARLERHGAVRMERAGVDGVERGIEVLNGFHRARWGKDVFAGDRLAFHQRVAGEAARHGQLALEVLTVGGRPVSVLYDLVVEGTKYGVQLGFDAAFDPRLSITLLHFGYSIEAAFAAGIRRYDFMRGTGRSGRDYKESITREYRTTATVQAVRNPMLRQLYRLYGRLRGRAGQSGPGAPGGAPEP